MEGRVRMSIKELPGDRWSVIEEGDYACCGSGSDGDRLPAGVTRSVSLSREGGRRIGPPSLREALTPAADPEYKTTIFSLVRKDYFGPRSDACLGEVAEREVN